MAEAEEERIVRRVAVGQKASRKLGKMLGEAGIPIYKPPREGRIISYRKIQSRKQRKRWADDGF